MTEKNERKESKAWLATLILGMGLAVVTAGFAFAEVFQSDPYEWRHANRAWQFILIIGLPVLVTSLILWFARFKKMPSVAFVVTMLTGGIFFLFSLLESISGMVSGDETELAGGFFQILVFTLPLFIAAWFLWTKPKVGAILLTILGLSMGTFMFFQWNRPEEFGDWIVPMMLCGVPIILGLFTFVREIVMPSKPLPDKA